MIDREILPVLIVHEAVIDVLILIFVIQIVTVLPVMNNL
jgi:hypothetical protein